MSVCSSRLRKNHSHGEASVLYQEHLPCVCLRISPHTVLSLWAAVAPRRHSPEVSLPSTLERSRAAGRRMDSSPSLSLHRAPSFPLPISKLSTNVSVHVSTNRTLTVTVCCVSGTRRYGKRLCNSVFSLYCQRSDFTSPSNYAPAARNAA